MKARTGHVLMIVVLLAAGAEHGALAGPGRITGTVTSKQGTPLSEAIVILEDFSLQVSTDEQGRYSFLGLPPGLYRLRASGIGFQSTTVREISLGEDQSLRMDLQLSEGPAELPGLELESCRVPMEIDQPNTRYRFSVEKITSLPTATVEELVATSPSTYGAFLRGSRQNETKVLVDGIDITNQYAGWYNQTFGPGGTFTVYNAVLPFEEAQTSGLMRMTQSSLQEALLQTGGVPADYPSATGGVIAYSLREGRGPIGGRLFVRSSQTGGLEHLGPDIYNDEVYYFRERDSLAGSSDPNVQALAEPYTYYTGKYPYRMQPSLQVEASLGGSLFEEFGFYLTGAYNRSSYRLPNESRQRANFTCTLDWDVVPGANLHMSGLLEDRGEIFGWKNTDYEDDFRFFLEGVPQWSGYTAAGTLRWRHHLSPESFYEVQLSAVRDQTYRGFSDDNGDGIMTAAEALTTEGKYMEFSDTSEANANLFSRNPPLAEQVFFYDHPHHLLSAMTKSHFSGQSWFLAHPGFFYQDLNNTSYTLKIDGSSRIGNHHELSAGAQVCLHDLKMIRRVTYVGGVFPSYKNFVDEDWHVRPAEYAFYFQDRIESEALIANVGVRLEGLNNDLADLANWFAPFEDGSDGVGPARFPLRAEECQPIFWHLSPRLGVAHPFSSAASVYFSFAQQQQSMPFSQIFANYNDFGNPSLPQLVRAAQEPIRSTTYELGLQWALEEHTALSAVAYFKDINNYSTVGLAVTPHSPWRNYNVTTNWGGASARGIELTVERNTAPVTDWLSLGGRLSYTNSYVKAEGGAGRNRTTFSTAGGDSALYGGGLPWDELDYFNSIERHVLGGSSTLSGGYDRTHRITYTIMVRFPADISLSAVGNHMSGFFYARDDAPPRARAIGEGPWYHRVDLRLEKGFAFAGVRIALFLDLINAFNAVNVVAYTQASVGQAVWEHFWDPTGGPRYNRPVAKSNTLSSDGTLVYDVPREFYFGLELTF